jgi:hypothetical protein
MVNEKHKRVVISRTLLVLLISAVVLGAQVVPKLEIGKSPSSAVVIAPFDPSVFPVFKDVFDPRIASLRAAALVVTNESNKAIIGISITWTLTDLAGRKSAYSNRTHSFLVPSSRPLALPHGHLLVAPETFVSEDVLLHPQGGVIGLMASDRTVARFSDVSAIRAEVDSIIFQDGEVVGPDQLGLVEAIQNRRDAAEKIVRWVEQSQDKGKDPAELLRQVVSSAIARGDKVANLQVMFADELLRARNFNSHLRYLKGIPVPPAFYRKDGGPL